MSTTGHNVLPDGPPVDLARDSSAALAKLLRDKPDEDRAQVRMDGLDLILPRKAIEMLRDILAEMAQGNAITLMPVQTELTTQEAANMLNVSRPHLIKLLESGELPYFKVGTHRRVRLNDLLTYKARRAEESEQALQALADQAQDLDMGY